MNPRAFGARGALHSKQSAATIDRRLGEIDSELRCVEQSTVDPEHVAATLAEFSELWDVLYPLERVKLVHSLIESVVYYDETDRPEIRFAATARLRIQPCPSC